VVTLSDAYLNGFKWNKVSGYLCAQFLGAIFGVALANRMFDLPYFFASTHIRQGSGQVLSEFVATFGLLAVIRGSGRRSGSAPFAVAAYIMAAYWFTASTSFANPAVTLARSLSDTFTGIRPTDVPVFILAQIAGAVAATVLFKWLAAPPRKSQDIPAPYQPPTE
jgi:glycerol uptake facilitator-like aquaporin